MGTSQQQLIEQFRRGDAKSFEALYDELFPFLFTLTKSITRDVQMAEDIVQEAFVALFDKREKIGAEHGIASIRAYMATTVRHEAFRAVQRRMGDEKEARTIREHIPISEDPAVFRSEVESECYQKMRQKIAHLPKTDQKVFELMIVNDLSVEEASEILNLNPRTIDNARSRVNVALQVRMASLVTVISSTILLFRNLF
ncbi:RNA polymerase sigma factor [Chitinophaga rhizosphaerae]|uniref:RNA polymerase sigma factor n=1 Tax=Chitinophaga rhizosphaerae TaxID=1864947 RepID=UPI000F811E94|nr:RNA polymerase sigma factor [Chitinophaga rhizosphaerae]